MRNKTRRSKKTHRRRQRKTRRTHRRHRGGETVVATNGTIMSQNAYNKKMNQSFMELHPTI